MTVTNERIQALVAEIDAVLSKASPSLPWVMSAVAIEQRQVLERARSCLAALQTQLSQPPLTGIEGLSLDQSSRDLTQLGISENRGSSLQVSQQASQQIVQAVTQELGALRASLSQTFQGDLEELRRERSTLLAEIKQLEMQRQQYLQAGNTAPTLPPEFWQQLSDQLQYHVSQQIAHHLANLPTASVAGSISGSGYAVDSDSDLVRAQALQARMDHLLMNLDSTLSVVFESLQRNLKAYQDSLGQGMDRMYDLGRQGEMMFAAWIKLLVDRWGREPAVYRQSAMEAGNFQAASNLTPEAEQILAQYGFGEYRDASRSGSKPVPGRFDLPSGGYERATSNLESLDLEDLDLSDLNLNAPSTDPAAPGPIAPFNKSPKPEERRSQPAGSERAVRPGSGLTPDAGSANPNLDLELDDMTGGGIAIEDDLDAAMAFLDELSTALQDQSDSPQIQNSTPLTAGDEISALLDDTEDSAAQEAELDREVDDFYSSLFGPDGQPSSLVQPPNADLTPDDLTGNAPAPAFDDVLAGFTNQDSANQASDQPVDLTSDHSQDWAATQPPRQEAPGTDEIFNLDLSERFDDPEATEQTQFDTEGIDSTTAQEEPNADTDDGIAAALIALEDDQLADLAAAIADTPADEPAETEPPPAEAQSAEPESDLFAPFADLLGSPADTSSASPTEADDRVQLEQFLFEEPSTQEAATASGSTAPEPPSSAESPMGMTWDDLGADLGNEAPEEAASISSGPSQASSSGDLADLVELLSVPSDGNEQETAASGNAAASNFENQPSTLDPLPRVEAEMNEEDFVAADPDETLLSTPDDTTERTTLAEISQWLSDGNFRQQLRDDLVNLENEPTSQSPPSESTQTDEVFAEFGEAIGEPPQPDLSSMPPGVDLDRLQQALSPRRHNPSGQVVMDQLRDWFSSVEDVPESQIQPAEAPLDLSDLSSDLSEEPDFWLDQPEDEASSDLFGDLARDLSESPPTSPASTPDPSLEISLPSQEQQDGATILDMFADFEADEDSPQSDQKKKILNPEDLVPDESKGNSALREWYLGIDLGTTGLSAVLYRCSTQQLFPICWLRPAPELGSDQALPGAPFRMAAAVLGSTPVGRDRSDQPQADTDFTVSDWGSLAIAQALAPDSSANLPDSGETLMMMNLKSWLKAGLPYQAEAEGIWQPIVQWSDTDDLSLKAIGQALQTLLSTLTASHVGTHIAAIGLEPNQLVEALQQLDGVALSCPPSWSETYTVNLRSAVLTAGLVRFPSQVFCVDNTIAALLPELNVSTRGAFDALTQATLGSQFVPDVTTAGQVRGSTLVISAGALTSELAVALLPDDPEAIAYEDFTQRSLPYAGQGLEQDIITQVIWPAWREQCIDEMAVAHDQDIPTLVIDPDPEMSAVDAWQSLQLEQQTLPAAAEPALPDRLQLQQRLMANRFGICLQAVARTLKGLLQHQSQLRLQYVDQTWVVTRRQVERDVLLPYIQRLNRELNLLLKQAEVAPQTINQVICTGGSASFPATVRWLRQKLSNATVIQDTYPAAAWANGAELATQLALQGCSRLAYGVALLPRYPKLLNQPRHQFNDYALLWALLGLVLDPESDFGARGKSLAEIMNALQRRGFDPQACQLRVQALLAGRLPAGLTATSEHSPLLIDGDGFSDPISEEQRLFRQSDDRYWPDLTTCDRLQDRLRKSPTEIQRLIESPLLLPLAVPSLTIPS